MHRSLLDRILRSVVGSDEQVGLPRDDFGLACCLVNPCAALAIPGAETPQNRLMLQVSRRGGSLFAICKLIIEMTGVL